LKSKDFSILKSKEREKQRENELSHNSRFIFLFFFENFAAEGDTSSATGVSDDLASVEREESNERLEAGSVIKASRKASSTLSLRATPSTLTLSGKRRGIEPNGEELTFARGTEREPGSSADSSRSKARACGESALKGLVIVAGAGSSNASRRASLVGFPFVFEVEVVLLVVVAFPVFLLAEAGEGRSSVERIKRFPLFGVEAGRPKVMLVLSVCAKWVCTGACASESAAAVRVVCGVEVSGEGVSVVAAAGTSAAVGRAKRSSASDRSTEMGGSEGAEDGGDSV